MRLVFAALLALGVFLQGCNPAAWKTANLVAAGVACGVAAAQETPCTPAAVLEALAADAAKQRARVEAVAPQAAAVDPVMAKLLLAQMESNERSNRLVAEALLKLAAQSAAFGPLPQYELPPLAPLPPPRAPAAAPSNP